MPPARRQLAEHWLLDIPKADATARVTDLPRLLPDADDPAAPPILEYSTEPGGDRVLFDRGPGWLRVTIPAAGRRCFLNTAWPYLLAGLLTPVVALLYRLGPGRYDPSVRPTLAFSALALFICAVATLNAAQDACAPCTIEVDLTQLRVTRPRHRRRPRLTTAAPVHVARFDCDEILAVTVPFPALGHYRTVFLQLKGKHRPDYPITGLLPARDAHAIAARLRKALGLVEPLDEGPIN